MYTHWQASRRSGFGVGVALLGVVLFGMWFLLAEPSPRRELLMLAAILGAALITLIVTASFRLGLRMSGRGRVGLKVVIATPILHMAALVPFYVLPNSTYAQLAGSISGQEALIRNVVVQTALFLVQFSVLPAIAAYACARVFGGAKDVV